MREGIFKRIKSLEIQSATNIAVESLKHLKEFSKKNGFGPEFDRECKRLLTARPTAVALHNALEELKKRRSEGRINELLELIENSHKKIAKNGIRIFRKKSVVMTHCHSSEVVSLLKTAKGRIRNVFVTETRPMYQGIKTAKELSGKMPVTLITDSAAGYFMPSADIVVVGADAIGKEGVINKIGTLPLAITSKAYNKPMYVAASSLKLDRRKSFEMEMRNPDEIHRKIRNVRIINPAFDITPWKYIAGVITEDGVMKPYQVKRMLGK